MTDAGETGAGTVTSSTTTGAVEDITNTATSERWQLLRTWHLEAMECVIDSPTPATFTRTTYLSVPASWRSFTSRQLAARIEQALNAHYRIRWATLRTAEVDERIIPFAFDFEWVSRADLPAVPNARSDPWTFPCAKDTQGLAEIAWREIDAKLQSVRPGIDARCYADAFEVFRVDEDDSWHIVDWNDRAAMFAARYEALE
jgi:hypothetical protein